MFICNLTINIVNKTMFYKNIDDIDNFIFFFLNK